MIYTYVDIGVADFETALDKQQPGETVLLVDPLAHYLDALPRRPDVTKVCAAIVDTPGITVGAVQSNLSVFHIPPPVITRMGFPAWVRGCNRVHEPHPAVIGLLANRGISLSEALYRGIVQITQCPFMTFAQLCDAAGITAIVNLKIDTEGCDHLILAAAYTAITSGRLPPPRAITFERIGYSTQEHGVDPYGNCAALDDLARRFMATWPYALEPVTADGAMPAGPDVHLVLTADFH